MEPRDLTKEQWREYDFDGRVYRIDKPLTLWVGTTTHRVLDVNSVVHCVPFPICDGKPVFLRWAPKDINQPVQF